jgi:hypothetical protein
LHFTEKIAKETPTGASTDVPQGGNGSVPGERRCGKPVAPAVLVNVALEGMVPVMMREGGGGGGGGGEWRSGGSGGGEAEMERECPLLPIRTLTTTTDPVVKVR